MTASEVIVQLAAASPPLVELTPASPPLASITDLEGHTVQLGSLTTVEG